MPPSAITIRRATRAELPRMARILLDAFASGPWGQSLFPPHLKVKPGDGDQFDWRLSMMSSAFDSPGREHVVACEAGEEAVGWAQWVDSGADLEGKTSAEVKDEASPPGLDTEALGRLGREGRYLEKRCDEYLRIERSKQSWLLNYLAIDPKHQRKGIGRRLTQEGLDRAASRGRDVSLRASPEGRLLYLTMGFKEVCEGKVMGGSQYSMVWSAKDGKVC
ncbi:hypothetical protein Daus18300_003965 [Diaporthe australafricana]|uniref:N-acetyltransferase domain-containing protein n=1 Tax=Diaporthe australafricana TaxID=127596 RepID=A0ABR3XBM5_9PEZI